MMEWTPINLEELPRKSQYLHFINGTGCDYSTTAEVDITALYRTAKKRGIKVNAEEVSKFTSRYKELFTLYDYVRQMCIRDRYRVQASSWRRPNRRRPPMLPAPRDRKSVV